MAEMNNRQLEYVIAIAEEGTLSKAADRLFVSQSALSQQLAKLKADGLPPLFINKRHRMELTDAGKIYLNGARSILFLDSQAIEAINNLKRKTVAQFHVSVAPYLQNFFYTRILIKLKKEYPDTKIYISRNSAGNTMSSISSNQIDLAFIPDIYKQLDFFKYTPVLKEELVIVSPGEDAPQDLPYILPRENSYIRELCQRIFSYYGKLPEIYAETNDFHTILDMIKTGSCCSILPRKYVSSICSDLALRSFPEPFYFDLVCMHKKGKQSEIITKTISLIEESL